MNDQFNIHATCVEILGAGILILGKSGSGKSDLALRFIENKGAKLVSDDRVDIKIEDGQILAQTPQVLQGLLEVRGVGIFSLDYTPQSVVHIAVELVLDRTEIERLPQEQFYKLGTVEIPLLKLFPFEASATDKVVIKLKAVLDKLKKNHKIVDIMSRNTTC